ncbi:MAG TPA: hypothetical protein VFB25_09610 [Gaiellaceae bacterium]|nr:hypothetical protein [Gaiellaceae bacterium]
MAAEADRLVQELRDRIRGVAAAVDDRRLGAGVAQPLQREQVHGVPEAATAMRRRSTDRLELADAVYLVEPRERGGRERSVRRLDNAVEVEAIRPRRHQRAHLLLGQL